MELYFNITREQLKALVHAIGEIVHITPVYRASSKRIFTLGNVTVDKDAKLQYDERTEQSQIDSLVAALATHGFPCERGQ